MKDATYWVQKWKKKELSLPEYYTELNRQVTQKNPDLNALVEWDFDALLKAAQNFTITEEAPFSGLAIPLKMLGQEKVGWKSTFSSRLFKENRSAQTSNFTNKLEQIGFIPAGQTNAPEFGFKNITDPVLYGPTRNPWNLDHSPGGSSGGAAAAVASGLFPIAGASDGGGSIRIPASFSGLIGLKPTRGAMPNGPGGFRGWQGASIDFALTVSMRDTEKLFYAMRGNDKVAPYHPPREEWETHALPKRLKIAYSTISPVHSSVSNEAKQAVKQVCEELQAIGHELTEVTYPVDGEQLMASYYLMNGAETSSMFAGIEAQLQRKMKPSDMELMTWGIYQYGERLAAKSYVRALNLWDQAAFEMETLYKHYDLFLTPTTAFQAPRIDQELQSDAIRAQLQMAGQLNEGELADLIDAMFEKSLTLSPYTQLANLTGQPAISLPTHVTTEGLPLGVQFMASKGREDLLFFAGRILEEREQFRLPQAYK
ncbi:amidase [Listeria aquatica]|uniref:amidase n=1 Tax=Listeria aquatica TaxID=1494960 RepID=UPI003F703BD8